MGVATPKVAILSAVETVNPNIPSTVNAAALCKMAERGQIRGGILDGPLAFDNAISAPAAPTSDVEAIAELGETRKLLLHELGKRIVGQREVVDALLTALFARGHCLLVGVPGLAKTLLISTLAERARPHLQPHPVHARPHARRHHRHRDPRGGPAPPASAPSASSRGPIFANMILADEINRTPPKTQAALLEAMQEHQVTAGGTTYPLDRPFFVLATQNPIEQEGTYPLPEAQLDRFMFNVEVDYPSAAEEEEIVRTTTSAARATLTRVLSPEKIRQLQELVLRVPVADHVVKYAVELARLTRPGEPGAPDFVKENVSWGAGPRAGQYLVLGAKSRAILDGRSAASVEDVRALARHVLVHRVLTNFRAESEGITSASIVERLLALVKG